MNRPIIRLYGLVAVLFALLVAFTSRWTIFEASSLRENKLNARALLEQERVDRGPILAADGTVLARSVRGAEGTYERIYPTGSQFANAIGYDYIDPGTSGLERVPQRALNGKGQPTCRRSSTSCRATNRRATRSSRRWTPPPSGSPTRSSPGDHGAVVALEPRSGAVTVMASSPSFDPNTLRSSSGYEQVRQKQRRPARQPRRPVRLRARLDVQGRHRHRRHRHRRVHARIDAQRAQRHPRLRRAAGQRRRRELRRNHAHQALAKSVNTVYAQVAEQLGKRTLARYMNRFGFDRKPQLDYPAEEMSASGEYEGCAAAISHERQCRRRAHGDRPGQTRGDAAADGRGGGRRRQRRAADGPAPDGADRRLRREHRGDGSRRACSRS